MVAESPTSVGEAKVVAMPQSSTVETHKPVEAQPIEQVQPATGSQPSTVGEVGHVEDEDEHLNTDDRQRFDWKGHYPDEAQREIAFEARVVAGILVLTFGTLLLTWRGTAFDLLAGDCATCTRATFDRYAYFYLGGQLGGILFGVKYLYKVVARGWWNLDRRLWRFFSPFLSGGLALVIGALTDSGVMGLTTKASSGAAYFSLGFIAGYFADSALAKMQEIADTVFGSPARRKHSPANTKR